ncbi:MAG: aminotransferase class V-fold PLP-dependent enzyme [Anaerolineae bacterium]|jgi:kynureninase
MNESSIKSGLSLAVKLDAKDPLARFRDEFVITEPDLIYLDGNSLGRLPRRTAERMRTVVEQEWGHELIRGWSQGWFEAPTRVGEKIAELLGAAPGQVAISDSTSVNLFKLVLAALSLRPERSRIVSDVLNFPSDLYILQGCIDLLGNRHHLDLLPAPDGIMVDRRALLRAIDVDTALVTLSHVTFKSGFLHDAAAITARARDVGALVLWDLLHLQVPEWRPWLARVPVCAERFAGGPPFADLGLVWPAHTFCL